MDYKLFIGIDQSKSTFDVSLVSKDWPSSDHHKQFDNTITGYTSMLKWISSLYPVKPQEMLFCSENTGLYSIPLCIFMEEKNLFLWLESPLQIKLSLGITRGKSDKIDSKQIATYCCRNNDKAKSFKLPSKTLRELKSLLAFRERLVGQSTALKISYKELEKFDPCSDGLVAEESKAVIQQLQQSIEKVDKKMLQLVESDPELSRQFLLVTSVHGVGKQTALFTLVYTNGFTLFDDWRKFSSYCGFAPFPHTSGTSIRGKTRVSNLANKKLKSLFTMCALNTIKKENEFKTYYDRRTKEGKNKMGTLNGIRNKLASRIFATIKRGTPYKNSLLELEMA